MPDPTVTDDEGTVSEDGLMTNPIFAIPADVGDIAYCRVIPPDGYEWVSGALTIPAIEHVSLSTNGIDWNADNTSLTINELISYPSGKMVFFRINSASNPAPSFVLPSDGLTAAVGNAAAGSFAASAEIVGAVTAWQTVSGAVAALAAATANVQVTSQKSAEGFVAALARIYATTVNIYQFLPTSLSSRTAGNGSFTVTVDAMDNVSRYDLRYKIWGTVTWTEVSDVGTGTEQVTGLTNGSLYQIQVRCWNSGTAGGWGGAGEVGSWYELTPATDAAAGSVAAATAITGDAAVLYSADGSVAASTGITGDATVVSAAVTYTETRYFRSDTDSGAGNYRKLLTSGGTSTENHALTPGTIGELDPEGTLNPIWRARLYKRSSGGTETHIATAASQADSGGFGEYTFSISVPQTSMSSTDRLFLEVQCGWTDTVTEVYDANGSRWVTEELGATEIPAHTMSVVLQGYGTSTIGIGGESGSYDSRVTNFKWTG